MTYHLLYEGDRVLSVNDKYIVIERTTGIVEFYSIDQLEKTDGCTIHSIITLDYDDSIHECNNDESYTTEDGVSIINF